MCDRNRNVFGLFTAAEECTIVQNSLGHHDFTVTSSKIEPVDDENVIGFLGDYFWLKIECEICHASKEPLQRKLRFFVKSAPLRDNEKRIRVMEYFQQEYKVYTNLLPMLRDSSGWHPKCCLARTDCLVLENIADKGYQNRPYGTPFDREHIECMLKSLAEMHACSFEAESWVNFEDDHSYILEERYARSQSIPFKAEMEATKQLMLSARFKDYHASVQKNFDKIKSRIFDLLRTSTKYKNVFSHVDLWASNIMFKYACKDGHRSPEHVVFLDFQLSRYLPPAVDVLIAIFLNTRRRERDRYLSRFLKFYWVKLQCALNLRNMVVADVLPWLEFKDSCDHYELLAIMFNCRYTPFSNLKPGTLQRMKPDERMHVCLEGRGEYILKMLEQNAKFRDIVLETIRELLEKYFSGRLNL